MIGELVVDPSTKCELEGSSGSTGSTGSEPPES